MSISLRWAFDTFLVNMKNKTLDEGISFRYEIWKYTLRPFPVLEIYKIDQTLLKTQSTGVLLIFSRKRGHEFSRIINFALLPRRFNKTQSSLPQTSIAAVKARGIVIYNASESVSDSFPINGARTNIITVIRKVSHAEDRESPACETGAKYRTRAKLRLARALAPATRYRRTIGSRVACLRELWYACARIYVYKPVRAPTRLSFLITPIISKRRCQCNFVPSSLTTARPTLADTRRKFVSRERARECALLNDAFSFFYHRAIILPQTRA